eukprot:gb/GFBE01074490.1/.p1 GENE.gb/GFBE01074490.1/~~gb/GFBE01074490.1/.p1  ORF type:complete len:451 (+),score=40.05 gb/GFBE01074490.1/:1-1353(+)
MPASKARLDVIVPQDMQPGQVIQAQAPDGTIVQATIPTSVQPGGTLTVEYTPASPSIDTGKVSKVLYTLKDFAVPAALIAAGLLISFSGSAVTTLLHVFAIYLLPAAIAALAVAYDWNNHGPTVALKHGVVAAAVAWLLVVPLGFVTDSLLYYVLWILLYAAVFLSIPMLLEGFGIVVGLLLLVLGLPILVNWGGWAIELMHGPLGHTMAFAVVFWFIRLYMGLVLPQHMNPTTWPNVTQVDRESEEFRDQADFLIASCLPWEHKYDFRLKVKNLYRIDRPRPPQTRVPAAAATGSRRLFHGTQWESAMGIVCDGFRLPTHAGMFGRGLYFADCPLKCWQYCWASKQWSSVLPRLTGRGGYVFMCWVELGRAREEKAARPDLSGYDRKGWWAWLTRGRGAYDSVIGVAEESGGALRVPEYIVYDPDQVRLAYMFEVEKEVPWPSSSTPQE